MQFRHKTYRPNQIVQKLEEDKLNMFIFIDKHNSISMPKKILVRESSFIDFVKSFFKAKSQGKEAKYIQTIRKYDSALADTWAKFDKGTDDQLEGLKKYWLKKGNTAKAKEIQDIIDNV